MNSLVTLGDIRQRASEVYNQGHYDAAASQHEDAIRIAHETDDRDGLFLHRFWAGVCWKLAGYPHRALTRMTEVLRDIPPDTSTGMIWMARMQVFRILTDCRPDVHMLTRRLEELRAEVRQTGQREDRDVCFLEATVLEERGRWDDAVRSIERAMQSGSRGVGFLLFQMMALAVRCCLRLGRLEEAMRWGQRLDDTEAYFSESRAAAHEARALIALWNGDGVALQRAAKALEEETDALPAALVDVAQPGDSSSRGAAPAEAGGSCCFRSPSPPTTAEPAASALFGRRSPSPQTARVGLSAGHAAIRDRGAPVRRLLCRQPA